ncbi:MAG: hypothetical protein R3E79_21425 [Caldilineaceae bacterium]
MPGQSKVFANIHGKTVEEFAANAAKAVEAGYVSLRAMPFLPNFEKQLPTQVIGNAVKIVDAIREAVGYEIDLGLKFTATCARRKQLGWPTNSTPSVSSTMKTRWRRRATKRWSMSPAISTCPLPPVNASITSTNSKT